MSRPSPSPGRTPEPSAGPAPRPASRWLALTGIVVLALALRPAVTSLGVALDDLRPALGVGPALAGVLTTLPVVCFAVVGAATSALTGRLGVHRCCAAAVLVVAVGLGVRGLTDATRVFLAASVLALSGIAVGNVALPHLVKLHFPDRIPAVAGLYSATLMFGAFAPSVVSLPVDQAAGTWRAGLLVWAVVAALSLLPWLALARRDVHTTRVAGSLRPRDLVRSRLAWSMALFCGLQSAMAYTQFGWLTQIYVDAGLDRADAALMLGLLTVVGIPLPLVLPWLLQRVTDHRVLVSLWSICGGLGFAGLLLAPTSAPWAWALLMGVGGCAFPYVLTMIGLRARTPEGVAVLSSFVQGIGYAIAAVGPLTAGLLYDLTDSWTLPLALLTALNVPLLLAGLGFARDRYLEDELDASRLTPAPAPPRGSG